VLALQGVLAHLGLANWTKFFAFQQLKEAREAHQDE